MTQFVAVMVGNHTVDAVEAYRWTPGLTLRVEGVEVLGGPILLWEVPSWERGHSQADRLNSGWIGARYCSTYADVEAVVREWQEAYALV